MSWRYITSGTDTDIYKRGKLIKKQFYDYSKLAVEMNIYKKLKQNKVRHLVDYSKFSLNDNSLTMKYYPYNLEEVITNGLIKDSDKDIKAKIMQQLIEFLNDCHNSKVSHNDFKAKNILVDKEFNIYVSDFDLSKSGDSIDTFDDYQKLIVLMLQIKNNKSYDEALKSLSS